MNYLKINKNISNIIIDYLLPNKEEIELNKLKMVKSIDFEYEHCITVLLYECNDFKEYLNEFVYRNPIENTCDFNLSSKSWNYKLIEL